MRWLGIAVALLPFTVACGNDSTAAGPPDPPVAVPGAGVPEITPWGETPVARVGDGVVTLERLQREMQRTELESRRTGRPTPGMRAVLDQLIQEELLVQSAVRNGLLANNADARDRLTRALLHQHERELAIKNPTDEELRAYYEKHKSEFSTAPRLRLRQVLVAVAPDASTATVRAARRKAGRLHRQARQRPEQLANLAVKHSDDVTAARGGALGMLPLESWIRMLGPEIEAAQTGAEPGTILPLVRSSRGFHVLQLVERTAPGADPLETQRREIAARYLSEKRSSSRDAFLSSLREDVPVEVAEDRLPGAAAAEPR